MSVNILGAVSIGKNDTHNQHDLPADTAPSRKNDDNKF